MATNKSFLFHDKSLQCVVAFAEMGRRIPHVDKDPITRALFQLPSPNLVGNLLDIQWVTFMCQHISRPSGGLVKGGSQNIKRLGRWMIRTWNFQHVWHFKSSDEVCTD